MVIFQLFVPLLLIASATMWGTRAVAAPEESGSLDLLLSLPISRRRFVLERFAAMVIGVVVVAAVVWILVLVLNTVLEVKVGFAAITAACAGLFLLALGFGMLAFGTYVLRSPSLDNDAIAPLRWLSPFHYYLSGDPPHEGVNAGYLAVLAGLVAAFAALAVTGFTRRDVGT